MLKGPIMVIVFSILIVSISIYLDLGSNYWTWFQRSGSLLTLCGAILGVRSYIRLGLRGFGGATPIVQTGIVIGGKDNDGMIPIKLDKESLVAEEEDRKDKISGVIGLIHVIIGTLIWGYGDLLGRVF